MVGAMWGYQLEQLLERLEASGMQLAPQQEQQQAALEALVADAEMAASRIIRSAGDDIAALEAELRAVMPAELTPEAMQALLVDSAFQMQLNDARSEALLVVSSALEPLLPGLAQAVHAALAPLVLAPSTLGSLAAFSGAQSGRMRLGFDCLSGWLALAGPAWLSACLLVPTPCGTSDTQPRLPALLRSLCCRCVPAAPC